MGKFTDHIDMIKSAAKIDIKVDYDKHKPTDGELNNICFMAMKYGAGHLMRMVDFEVVKTMSESTETVTGLSDKFLPVLADYMWDHIMGEPDDPSTEEVLEFVTFTRDMIYTSNEEDRNNTDSILEPDTPQN